MKLRKAIAVLLVLIFALIALPALFLKSISVTYLNPDFYDGKIIDKSYEYIVNFISDEVSSDEDVKGYFSKEDIAGMVKKYIPANLVHDLATDFTSQLKSINDGRKQDSIVISLMPIKDNMGSIAQDISVKIIGSIPACEPVAEGEEEVLPEYVDGKPACIPAGFDTTEILQNVKYETEKELNNIIPGEFTLELSGDDSQQATFRQMISFVSYLQIILPLFMLVFLLLIALFIYSPYSLVSKFTGAALFLAGVFGLIVSQLLSHIPSLVVTQENFSDLLAEELSSLTEIYSFFIGFIVEKMSIYSLYLLGIGIVIVLFGLYLHHFHEHTEEHSQ
ncbi:hypothetical protein C0416_03115 [bacterium]|nr:hypothetical protein [bacterium]